MERLMAYKVERLYFKGGKRVIDRGLTLEQAQAHCSDPETSSRTCTTATGRARTRRMGEWFDSHTNA
jgi:hypothetical protein